MKEKLSADILNNNILIVSGRETVVRITGIKVAFASGESSVLTASGTETEGSCLAVSYSGDKITAARLTFLSDHNGIAAKIELSAAEKLAAENSVVMEFETGRLTGAVTIYPSKIWWTYPCFSRNKSEWHDKTQLAVLQAGNAQKICLLPLVGNDFATFIGSGGISLSVGAEALRALSGTFMMITASDGPIKAVSSAYTAARNAGYISVPLLSEKKIPGFADYFGWCSWNATYQDVTEDKLKAKMEEIKEKKIPVRWVIIDDGWQDRRDKTRLWDFEADKEKFPLGLKHAVDMIKSYGDIKVGVWHTLNVYWSGIAKDSPITEKYADCLTFIEGGEIIPSLDPEKAYLFWKEYHSFLRSCGVDFLKVDNQGSYMNIVRNHVPTASAARNTHAAMERSVAEIFGENGALRMIDCMGMPEENVLSRPLSAINRNSDDFFPDKENGFVDHIVQNAWNAPWHSMLYLCDFDMWWSRHESADQSAILRAISGGPVYVSDKIGESEPEVLKPLMDGNGRIYRFPHAAMPTIDCFFIDCAAAKIPLKLFNRCGDNFAAAAWNISGDPEEDELSVSDIPGIDSGVKYMAYEYFSKRWQRFDLENSVRFSLEKNGVAAWSIFPIKDGMIKAGGLDKYFPAACPPSAQINVNDLV